MAGLSKLFSCCIKGNQEEGREGTSDNNNNNNNTSNNNEQQQNETAATSTSQQDKDKPVEENKEEDKEDKEETKEETKEKEDKNKDKEENDDNAGDGDKDDEREETENENEKKKKEENDDDDKEEEENKEEKEKEKETDETPQEEKDDHDNDAGEAKVKEDDPEEKEKEEKDQEDEKVKEDDPEENREENNEVHHEEEKQEKEQEAGEGEGDPSGRITVPPRFHGFLIGPKGATLKEIQEETDCHITVPRRRADHDKDDGNDSKEEDEDLSTVIIEGKTALGVKEARERIQRIMDDHADLVDEDTAEQRSYAIPAHLHKYVVGPDGSHIQQVQKETRTKIHLQESDGKDNDNDSSGNGSIVIMGHGGEESLKEAYAMLETRLNERGWFYDSEKEQWFEDNPNDKLWAEARKEAEALREERHQCIEESQRAYDADEKERAKELSEKAKELKEKEEAAQKKAAQTIFNAKNESNDEYTMDLHGLMVHEAMEFVKERVESLLAKGDDNTKDELAIITGAGNHSEDTAKIKPEVESYLQEKGLEHETQNSGTIAVSLKSNS